MTGASWSERDGAAMGTTFHVLALSEDQFLADRLVTRLQQLESMWSRFDPSSEISRVNSTPDEFHLVSPETTKLIETARTAWSLTDGAFDPTVLDSMEAIGYDRTLAGVGATHRPTRTATMAPGCGGFTVDSTINMVRLGGARFDPGGIGKGLAADIAVAEAMASGAAGAMVNIGGDVVCRGHAPTTNGWIVDVTERSVLDHRLALVDVSNGAIATSTIAKRRWNTDDGPRHHLVDPSTGRNTQGYRLATVIASDGWYAEAITKHLLVGGCLDVVDTTRAVALVVDDQGASHTTNGWNDYLR